MAQKDGSFEERGQLIETILNQTILLPENAPREVVEGIDTERQLLALRAGWSDMPIEELRALVNR